VVAVEEDAKMKEKKKSSQANDCIGMLNLKIVRGKLLRDTEHFGKLDPLIIIKYKGKHYKTEVSDRGGQNPIWNDEIEIPV
jgi:Ca2+-dependent lipid-binding protein